jgi:hypothetical protein
MATQLINTRIKNKADVLSAWQSYSGTLLNGEIAIVRVPTGETYNNPVTGAQEPVVELLMKVGDGSTAFASLPWLSAKASDVYSWAKTPESKDIEIAVIKGSDNTATTSTLGTWLKTVYDAGTTNAADIASNKSKIDILNGSNTTAGSVAKVVKDAIDALDYSTSTTDSSTSKIAFVTAVTQSNGKIAVKKRNIIEADLPSISASKITVDSTTLDTKISDMDAAIAANTSKLTGHTDAAINTLITNKINALNVSDSGSGYVTKVTQTNGKITVTKADLPTASDSTAGIATLGATGGAATYDAVSALTTRVSTAESDITSLKTSVAGGVHFVGTTTTELTDGATINPVTINSKSHTPSAGDVVLYGEKEFIWTGSAWEELGDLTRVGTLETWRNKLKKSDTAVANQFITELDIAADGTVTIKRAQPTSAGIKHGESSTVDAALTAHDTEVAKLSDIGASAKVGATIDSKISTALDALDFTSPSASSTTTSFIDTVSQANGKISATKKTITSASTSASGIVKLSSDTDSTSEELAATPKAVKAAYDLANEAKADAAAKAPAEHEHPEYINQNAFSTIAVSGQTSVAADSATGTLTFAGSNVSITTDATNDKVTFSVANGTTGAKGVVQLQNTIDTSTTTAATPNIVNTVNTKAVDAQTRVSAVESNYVKFNSADHKLYVGTSGADEIIFDCGGASDETSAASYSMRMTTPTVSSGSDGVFEPNGDSSNLTSVEVNGEVVDPSNYSVL